MESKIKYTLSEIESAHGIKLLYACESGSRAWGFPSPDSDYDIRFIYCRPVEDYLSIRAFKDSIRLPIIDDLDIEGWDIFKTLQLMSKSNTTVFEWLQSPIVYFENEDLKNGLWKLSQSYFCPRSNIHHYLGIAKGALASINEDRIKIKKLFYVLRPLLAALWCAERNSIAPMDMQSLMELLPKDLSEKILSLIKLKSGSDESSIIEVDKDLKLWINNTYFYCEEKSGVLEKRIFDIDLADNFLRKLILK